MPEGILVFDLKDPDDQEKFAVANQADAMYFALWDIQNTSVRNMYKYQTDTLIDRVTDLLKSAPLGVKEAVIEAIDTFSDEWRESINDCIDESKIDLEIYS